MGKFWDKMKKEWRDVRDDMIEWGDKNGLNSSAGGREEWEAEGTFFDPSDLAKNKKRHTIEFYHVATKRSVSFKAYVTDFSDDYTSNWSPEEVYGRMDPIQTFSNTQRTISLSWEVVAGSEQEAVDNLKKCSELQRMLYPTYVGTSLAAPPLIKLKFVNLVQDSSKTSSLGGGSAATSGLTVSTNTYSWKPDFEHGVFDIGIGTVYPQLINLTASFTALHSHQMGLGINENSSYGTLNPSVKWEKFPYNASKKLKLDTNKGAQNKKTEATERENDKNSIIVEGGS